MRVWSITKYDRIVQFTIFIVNFSANSPTFLIKGTFKFCKKKNKYFWGIILNLKRVCFRYIHAYLTKLKGLMSTKISYSQILIAVFKLLHEFWFALVWVEYLKVFCNTAGTMCSTKYPRSPGKNLELLMFPLEAVNVSWLTRKLN